MVVRNNTMVWRTLTVALLGVALTGAAAWMTFGMSTVSIGEMTTHKELNLNDQDKIDVRLGLCDMERVKIRMGIEHIRESIETVRSDQREAAKDRKEILKRLPSK